ncbi:hypothetical protein K2173_014917 [Erythroxylum novogranatense]|uniref:Essential protein Yae1 N-terminal domain-containing protein n=1 Tax=Erythroxylum novogranatense TaxID=1862640 RepID=A0AAV8TIF4_9ROSI|nr:hypothetical protein K2173_014917 [Erythroxylum novogranatense]
MEEGSLSKEIYSEILQTSNTRLDPTQTVVDDLAVQEDDSLFCLDGELGDASELEREWQKRFQQHHAIGYHDGLMAGIDASSQEGFNIGFKESVLAGYKWGIVRGITSAFACLPCDVKERIIETQERRNQLEGLYESVHSLSTIDALQLFHSDMMRKEKVERKDAESSSSGEGLQKEVSDSSSLQNYIGELESLLVVSPAIESYLSLK